ncbi:hypothetical protein [Thermocrinis sp.]|jgi:hypothetical protein|uniref:hypothetical protein n=1 Tax=Thermocrinis sp. TaxID=2024383 RepID=UPI00260BB9A9|nr:hypothetical protein [Thermocrinis sp.]
MKFLLFDKEKRFYPIFGDILDITGHKLLVALDEKKAKDLLKAVPPDFLILRWKDKDFFRELLKEGYFVVPIFLVEDYQQAEELRKFGFSDFNILILPFNPLEFLNKSAKLYQTLESLYDNIPSDLGMMNLFIYLLSRNTSTGVFLNADGLSCELYLKAGAVRGFSCSTEHFKEIIKSDNVSVKLLPYTEEAKLITYFKNNAEFFSMLLEEVQPQPSTVYPEVVQETVLQEVHKEVQPSAPSMLSVEEGLFLINSLDPEGLLQRNMYLRVYEKGDSYVSLLFNVLPYHRFSAAKDEIEKAVGKLENLKALILMDLLPEDTLSILNLLNLAPKLYVITSLPIALSLIDLGVPERRIKLVESFPDGLLNLGTGDVLRFIKTPFLPEKGSFVVFEEKTKTLFSSKLFSSYCLPEEYSVNETAKIERVVLYHRLNFSNIENAVSLAQIRLLNPSVIRPAFGNPILDGVDEVVERISKQKNTFNLANLEDEALIFGILSSILFELEKRIPKEKYELILDGLSEYVEVEGGSISNSFVDVKKLPELFIYTLHSAKVPPTVLLLTLERFLEAEIPVFTI